MQQGMMQEPLLACLTFMCGWYQSTVATVGRIVSWKKAGKENGDLWPEWGLDFPLFPGQTNTLSPDHTYGGRFSLSHAKELGGSWAWWLRSLVLILSTQDEEAGGFL